MHDHGIVFTWTVLIKRSTNSFSLFLYLRVTVMYTCNTQTHSNALVENGFGWCSCCSNNLFLDGLVFSFLFCLALSYAHTHTQHDLALQSLLFLLSFALYALKMSNSLRRKKNRKKKKLIWAGSLLLAASPLCTVPHRPTYFFFFLHFFLSFAGSSFIRLVYSGHTHIHERPAIYILVNACLAIHTQYQSQLHWPYKHTRTSHTTDRILAFVPSFMHELQMPCIGCVSVRADECIAWYRRWLLCMYEW